MEFFKERNVLLLGERMPLKTVLLQMEYFPSIEVIALLVVYSDEIEKLRNALVLKREVCCETIKKKTKMQTKLWKYELENKGMFDNIAGNLMKWSSQSSVNYIKFLYRVS